MAKSRKVKREESPSKSTSGSSPVVAVFTADCHLESRGCWASRPAISGDAFHAFEQTLAAAYELEVPLIVGGDLFDSNRPDSATVVSFSDLLRKYTNDKVRLLYVQGNHEQASPPWVRAFHGHDEVASAVWLPGSECVELGGDLCLTGIDSTSALNLPEVVEKIPDSVDVLVTHQSWAEVLPAAITSHDGHAASLFRLPLILNGDIHVHKIVKTRRELDGGNMTIVSPGSTHMRAINEDPMKWYCLLHEDLSVTAVPLRTRQVIRTYDIVDRETLDRYLADGELHDHIERAVAASSSLPTGLRSPLVWFHVHADLLAEAGTLDRIRAVCDKQGAHLFLKTLGEATEFIDVSHDNGQHLRRMDLVGCVPMVAPDESSRLHRNLMRVLDSATPELELEALRKEVLQED